MHADMEIGAERAVATATAVCVIKCPMTGLSLSSSLHCFTCRHAADAGIQILADMSSSHPSMLISPQAAAAAAGKQIACENRRRRSSLVAVRPVAAASA